MEKRREDLAVGDVIIAKQTNREFKIVSVMAGPYLTLETGQQVEHDTSMDGFSSTYTVKDKQ